MTKAIKTAREVIRNKVAVMNIMLENNNHAEYTEALKRHESEVRGMLIVLKNIDDSGVFYNIHFLENCYEFGYYDTLGKWHIIEKTPAAK